MFTRERLRRLMQAGSSTADDRVRFIAEPVTRIDAGEGEYVVKTASKRIPTPVRPILATGIEGSLTIIRELFEWDAEGGFPVLTAAADESTRTPGLFVCGPMVRHRTRRGWPSSASFTSFACALPWRPPLSPSVWGTTRPGCWRSMATRICF
jgi:hypothetical protein